MSSAPKAGKKSFSPGSNPKGQVGTPERTDPVKGFSSGSSMESQVGNPERTAPAPTGSQDSPTSMKSHIVPPASAPKSAEDPGVRNKGK